MHNPRTTRSKRISISAIIGLALAISAGAALAWGVPVGGVPAPAVCPAVLPTEILNVGVYNQCGPLLAHLHVNTSGGPIYRAVMLNTGPNAFGFASGDNLFGAAVHLNAPPPRRHLHHDGRLSRQHLHLIRRPWSSFRPGFTSPPVC